MPFYIIAKIHCNQLTCTYGHDGLYASHGYIALFFPTDCITIYYSDKCRFYYQAY